MTKGITVTSDSIKNDGMLITRYGLIICFFTGWNIYTSGIGFWSAVFMLISVFLIYLGIAYAWKGYTAEIEAVKAQQ